MSFRCDGRFRGWSLGKTMANTGCDGGVAEDNEFVVLRSDEKSLCLRRGMVRSADNKGVLKLPKHIAPRGEYEDSRDEPVIALCKNARMPTSRDEGHRLWLRRRQECAEGDRSLLVEISGGRSKRGGIARAT